MKISVVIPFDNKINDLKFTFDHLKRNVSDRYILEIIIVNGCTDDKMTLFESIDPQMKVIIVSALGKTKKELLNIGLEQSTGEYIIYLRAGDLLNSKLFCVIADISSTNLVDIISYSVTHSHYKFDMYDDDPFTVDNFSFIDCSDFLNRKKILLGQCINNCYFGNAYKRRFVIDSGIRFNDDVYDEDSVFTYPLLFMAEEIAFTEDHGYCMMTKCRETNMLQRIADRMVVLSNLLSFLQSVEGLYEEYKEEIDYYFVREYYLKNLKLARSAEPGTVISLRTFDILKLVTLRIVPKWIDNDYMFMFNKDEYKLMSLLYTSVDSEMELEKLLKEGASLSIITTTYNRSDFLKTSMECILLQTWQNFEYIVIDDGSTDGTETVVKSFDDKRIKYIKNECNIGLSKSKNVGLANASGDFVVYQDDDDFCRLDKMEKEISSFLGLSDEYGMVYCESINHAARLLGRNDIPPIIIPARNIPLVRKEGYIFPTLLPGNIITSTAVMFRKKALDEVGGFDQELFAYEDWEMNLRMARKFMAFFIPEPLYDYYQRPNTLISKKDDAHRRKVLKSLYDIDVKYSADRMKLGIESSFRIVEH